MNKEAISVTLRPENLLWLRSQVRATGVRSVSEVLDRVVANARAGGVADEGGIRSVKGTIRIAAGDAGLERADAAVRAMFPQRRRVPRRSRKAVSP